MLDQTITLILAGAVGEALAPLTRDRVKAAIPFGGEYRIIDFTLTNCLHSGLRHILVLTEDRSHSLHNHLRDGWSVFVPALGEYVTPVPPQHRAGEPAGSGTLAAIRRSLELIRRSRARCVLVLTGDHVYRMDYGALIEAHLAADADVTVACIEGLEHELAGLTRVSCDASGRITGVRPCEADAGIPGQGTRLGVMGVYALRTASLAEIVESACDAGAPGEADDSMLPRLVGDGDVRAYRFGGTAGRVTQDRYWSDVPDLDAYFRANMGLLDPVPALDLYQTDWPIWSHSLKNPPARTVSSHSGNVGIFVNSIVANGTVVTGGAVNESVLSPGVKVSDSATVERCILFHGVHVGEGAQLRNCIVDKHARIAPGDRIGFDRCDDGERFHVTAQGVVVVPKGYGRDDLS